MSAILLLQPISIVSITSTSVTFSSGIAPNNTPANVGFTGSPNPGNSTSWTFYFALGNGTSHLNVVSGIPLTSPIVSTITGLSPNTTYSGLGGSGGLTLEITGGSGSSGASPNEPVTFTTAPAVSLGVLTNLSVGTTTASISHPVAQNGTPGFTFQWYRSAGSAPFTPGPGTILVGETGVTLNDTGLSASSTYSYICVVTDAASYTANSPQLTLTTNANLAIATPSVTLVGSVNSFLSATPATGGNPPFTYQWYRATSGSGFTPGPSNILAGKTSLLLADTGLTAATTYYYKIVATDSLSNTITSSAANLTTAAALTVSTPTLTSNTATTAIVNSTGAAGGLAPYTYQWYRSTTSGFVPSLSTLLTGQTTLALHDSGLSPLTTYFYILQATDTAFDVTNSSQLSVTTSSAPLSLGNLTVNSVGQTAITITAPNATGGAPAYTYAWHRSLVSGSIGSLLSFTTQTITDTGLSADTRYFYTCTVTDSASPTPATANSPQSGVTTTAVSTLGSYYADLLILQYVGQPKFYFMMQQLCNMMTLPATSTQTADNILDLVIQNAFNIATATGTQLDIIGRYLGITRVTTNFNGVSITLSDSDFQTLIKLAAAAQISGTSLFDIDNFLFNNFPGQVFVTDNEDMSISYLINSSIGSQDLIDAFVNEQLLPKPLGVQISSVIVNPSLNFFGFSSINSETGQWIPAAPLIQGFNDANDYNSNSPWLDATMAIITGI